MDEKKQESVRAHAERLKERQRSAAQEADYQDRLRRAGVAEDREPDVFDRLVAWGIKFRYVKWLGPIYSKYKEYLLYALFGLGTMLISINVYLTLTDRMGWTILIAEAVSWFFATLFAFLTNRKWVFTYAPKGTLAFFQQLVSFFFGRSLTLGLEEAILHIFVLGFGFPNMKVEYVAQIFIIIANYVFSKLVVFRRRTIARRHTRRFSEENPDGYRSEKRK